jgi:hypothetical protein
VDTEELELKVSIPPGQQRHARVEFGRDITFGGQRQGYYIWWTTGNDELITRCGYTLVFCDYTLVFYGLFFG